MSLEAFNSLVEELKRILQSQCVNLVWPQVEIRKFVAIVIYKLVHGTSDYHWQPPCEYSQKQQYQF
jgi:hypothetical protein